MRLHASLRTEQQTHQENHIMTNVWIRSADNPSAYLRVDGSKVSGFNGGGSGTVNCQYYGPGSEPQSEKGNDEVFLLVPISGPLADDSTFAIRSVASTNAYLRVDGSAVTQSNSNGSGTVNCQYYAAGTQPEAAQGNDEAFELVAIPESPVFAIRSLSFPNVFLRLNGTEVQSFRGNGAGIVNCQFYAGGELPQWTPGNLETFYISGTVG
jgi:phospholipase C